MPDPAETPRSRASWHAYYSEKRIVHQWLQVALLKDLPVSEVLEVGPYLGLVTAMLTNAGYRVTTLDIEGERPRDGAVAHIRADVRHLAPESLRGFDAILCCETLEHLPFDAVPGVLAALRATGAPYLVLSVPYEGPQAGLSLYLNPHQWPRLKFFRKVHFLRRFPAPRSDAWENHRWEIGYRGYPLRKLTRAVEAAGYRILRRDFTSGTRSAFLVCENATDNRR
ncbi:MAG: class I SAM-dependent methyltransferase [Alphaproteobacteria bacterium]